MFLAREDGLTAAGRALPIAGPDSTAVLFRERDERPLQFLEGVLPDALDPGVEWQAAGPQQSAEIGFGDRRQRLTQLAPLGLRDSGGPVIGEVLI